MTTVSSPIANRGVAIVVMGVSGSGKSTLAARLAQHADLVYIEGDDLHTEASVEKMRNSIALDDHDRQPWLARIAALLEKHLDAGTGVVVTCSALKKRYRDVLRKAGAVQFLYLDGSAATFSQRMSSRANHYMPTALLDSQLQTLEPPEPGEQDVVTLPAAESIDTLVTRAASRLKLAATPAP